MNRETMAGFGIGLGAGVLIGGIVAILYAPQSGKETRTLIKDKTLELVEKVKALPADARAVFNKATLDDVKKR